jgi:hypothetical protein
MIVTPHALKLLGGAEPRSWASDAGGGRGSRLNSGHAGTAAVKAAPTARRFAVVEP